MFKYSLVIISICVFLLGSSAYAFDLIKDGGLEKTAEGTGHTSMQGITGTNPAESIGKIIKYLLSFVGVIFLVLMIAGGYQWMMSAGNEQTVEKAKNTIKSAIIGIIIVLAAYAITAFIGGTISANSVQDCIDRGGTPEEGGGCSQGVPLE